MLTTLGINHMRSQRTDIAQLTVFQCSQITVARQRDSLAVNRLDAMHHIVCTVNPCQYDMSYL